MATKFERRYREFRNQLKCIATVEESDALFKAMKEEIKAESWWSMQYAIDPAWRELLRGYTTDNPNTSVVEITKALICPLSMCLKYVNTPSAVRVVYQWRLELGK